MPKKTTETTEPNMSGLLTAHLAEYNALRQELLQILKSRDNLIIISLTITGAILSFIYSKGTLVEPNRLALYLLTPLSTVEAGLWLTSTYRIRRLSDYIYLHISPQIKMLFPTHLENNGEKIPIELFNWENPASRQYRKKRQRIILSLIHLLTIIGSGFLGQILLIEKRDKCIIQAINQLEHPFLYYFNCLLLLLISILFFQYMRNKRTVIK